MKKRRIILAASMIMGLSLSLLVCYLLFVEKPNWKIFGLYAVGGLSTCIAMYSIIKNQMKET